jgi:hypothetical protein
MIHAMSTHGHRKLSDAMDGRLPDDNARIIELLPAALSKALEEQAKRGAKPSSARMMGALESSRGRRRRGVLRSML